jgi:hypothetical protein
MTKLKLIQTGGFLGKKLSASTETDLPESTILKALEAATPRKNLLARDAFNYALIVNGKLFSIEPNAIGELLEPVINELMDSLVAED